MILIFSSSRDPSTNGVVSWLKNLKKEYFRINNDNHSTILVNMQHNIAYIDNGVTRISADDISAVWYRKGPFFLSHDPYSVRFNESPGLTRHVNNLLRLDRLHSSEYFHLILQSRKIRYLGNPFLGDPNKLIVLHYAASVGLQIPPFSITNTLSPDHIKFPFNYIIKSISNNIYHWDSEVSNRGYFSYTESLDSITDNINIKHTFPISCIQYKVHKQFEIRTLFLVGKFISAAIYSQNDPQTSVDYRKYNLTHPNRNVPIKLPKSIRDKLTKLFELLELNVGVVDMIVDRKGNYVFLEINPFGMYGNLETICNFQIDRAIATWLSGGSLNDWTQELGYQ